MTALEESGPVDAVLHVTNLRNAEGVQCQVEW